MVGLFLLGGGGYVALELLYRGRSHYSMFLAGGICFLLLGKLEEVRPRLPGIFRPLAGAGIITMVELAAGLLFNRVAVPAAPEGGLKKKQLPSRTNHCILFRNLEKGNGRR